MGVRKDKGKGIKLNIPPVLFKKTQKLIKIIEKETGRSFVSYWSSPAGSVNQYDVLAFYEVLQKLGPRDELVLFIKSNGGTGHASLRIVNLLRQYAKRLFAYLPLNCASAATMLALGADEIMMGPLAYLTPVDTSIGHDLAPVDRDNDPVRVSQDELDRILKLWNREHDEREAGASNPYGMLFPHIHPLVIGAVDRASSLSVKLCTEILRFHMRDVKKAEKISYALNSGYPSHNYPIILKEARRIGLKVKVLPLTINDLLLELNELYSEMGQRALTDYDERNYHTNEITQIIEGRGVQIYYQRDKDWHYRSEERSWIPMNDYSSWRKIEKVSGKEVRTRFHIR